MIAPRHLTTVRQNQSIELVAEHQVAMAVAEQRDARVAAVQDVIDHLVVRRVQFTETD